MGEAVLAAAQTSEATSAILRHAIEGGGFGIDTPVVALLTEALGFAIGIHVGEDVEECDTDYLAALEALRASTAKFLEEWAA